MPQLRVYTLNDLTPEVRAVTFAKCSRSAEPFDVIAKEVSATKAAEFHEKWVVGYGHSSVAEHAILSLAIENISILATKFLEDTRLASYTEKSTRYQIFNRDTCYYPATITNSPLANDYREAITGLFAAYEKLSEPMAAAIRQKYPQKPNESDILYKNVCKSRACDNLRYLLPTATLTNLGMTVNARILEHTISKLLSSPLVEFQEIGEQLKTAALKETPTLIKYANKNEYRANATVALKALAQELLPTATPAKTQAVTIVDYDRDAEDKLVAALLYPETNLPYQQILEKVKSFSQTDKEKVIDRALADRGQFDAPLRELEHIYYSFDILMDYGAFRDVQRHRMCTQTNQLVTTAHGYDTPPEMVEFGFEKDYTDALDRAAAAYQKIAASLPLEAQYVVPLAFRKRTLFTWNLRELHHFISLRSGQKGHASYRLIAQECWRELNKIQPLLAKYIKVDLAETGTSWAANLKVDG